ncbi:dihydrofolate reductase [Prevotella sp. A2931]|uniref:Dihydrofolate reductase n=1 Tax=Prevotella illustrans TaxID=2800387 RepID=A0ABS3M2Q7_9BACT|nr:MULTISPECIES: dihydrofolate reductase [Prevotella]MBO1362467.1 dihydrofolate reductase [Prevotella illustrans]PTL25024.1 dihydrofolate reductase [Prevotella sp. oral taxon 820]
MDILSTGSDTRFADIQMLRYHLQGFDRLSLKNKIFIYYLAKATLVGRDITTDQFGAYNIVIRKTLEKLYRDYSGDRSNTEFLAFETYLRQIWFANGIYHHYSCDKFRPAFSKSFFISAFEELSDEELPLAEGQTRRQLLSCLLKVIFDKDYLPKRVNKADGDDLVLTSACNYYEDVTQAEVEAFYRKQSESYVKKHPERANSQPSWGLNSRLIKRNGKLEEEVYARDGRYSKVIEKIIYWLERAVDYAETDQQKTVIRQLIKYYTTGDLSDFDQYSIEWLKATDGEVDFINGFIEVYGDPLGLKGSWEGIVEYKNLEATARARRISENAQWFEDHSPIDSRFRKKKVKGVIANVVCAAMLGGDEYPSSAIGINLPNADWIRAVHGSKSVSIFNLTEAYHEASRNSGMLEEFVVDGSTLDIIKRYGDVCDDLHTDLHECLGHGSGQLLPGTDPNALKHYGNTIEEARADLFGLYYMADAKLVELGLLPDDEAYKSQYYTYLMNGVITQLVRIKPGERIEESHMQNRALIGRWVLSHGKGIVSLSNIDGKHYITITDYAGLRGLFARLLAEIQRVKSEGDFAAARLLVETYGIQVDSELHEEVLARYGKLRIAPYEGFINPKFTPVKDAKGEITDVRVDYTETYTQQMLRYGEEYGIL